MPLKRWLGKVLVYVVLELGALCGVPVQPDQIERYMKIQETQAVQIVRDEEDDDS